MTLFIDQDCADQPLVRPRRGRRARVLSAMSGVLIATLVFGGVWAAMNRQWVTDQFTVWNFEPHPAVSLIMANSSMTDRGEFLFLASSPVIESSDALDSVCASQQEDVGILGCYLPDNRVIYLYDVTDERLNGLSEVVASHEMLHAAWDRMSESERAELAPLLEAQARKLADDADFTARMDFYARTEPGERANELHSIIGTEIADLSPALEKHYAAYFSDRAALVALHVASNSVFEDLKTRAEALIARLDALRAGVESDYASYSAGYATLNADITEFNRQADAGSFATQAEFDNARAALFARRDALDALYASIQTRTAEYEAGVSELDSLNAQVTELNASINIPPLSGTDG